MDGLTAVYMEASKQAVLLRVCASSFTSGAVAAGLFRLLVRENRLRLVHMMHSGAGVAPLVCFTGAKRLLKLPATGGMSYTRSAVHHTN